MLIEWMKWMSDVEFDVASSGVHASLNHVPGLAMQFTSSQVAQFAGLERNDAGMTDSCAATARHEDVCIFSGLK